MGEELVPEPDPDEDQKRRLDEFLSELMLLTRKYRILVHDRDEALELIDLSTGRLVGLGLAPFTAPADDMKIVGYVVVDSILDGAWLV